MKTYIVDAFTSAAFKGNPAGVCFPERAISDQTMQQVAMELGLSETAFVWPTGVEGIYDIRYFSPKKEIPLCGHATLASAKIIFNNTAFSDIHFITATKVDLPVQKSGDAIIMSFPVYELVPVTVPPALLQALGIAAVTNTAYSEKNKIILLEIADAAVLAALSPDFAALLQTHNSINGVLVTAPSNDNQYDFHYRYFWPWAGTNEDPVTGGVQTFLTKYWSKKLGKTTMKAFQSSARTGEMTVELQEEKVLLTGQAVIVLEGNWMAVYNELNRLN